MNSFNIITITIIVFITSESAHAPESSSTQSYLQKATSSIQYYMDSMRELIYKLRDPECGNKFQKCVDDLRANGFIDTFYNYAPLFEHTQRLGTRGFWRSLDVSDSDSDYLNICQTFCKNFNGFQYCEYLVKLLYNVDIDNAFLWCHVYKFDLLPASEYHTYLSKKNQFESSSGQDKVFTITDDKNKNDLDKCLDNLYTDGYTFKHGSHNYVYAFVKYLKYRNHHLVQRPIAFIDEITNPGLKKESVLYTNYMIDQVKKLEVNNTYVWCCTEDIQRAGFTENINEEIVDLLDLMEDYGECDNIKSLYAKMYCVYIDSKTLSGDLDSISEQSLLSPSAWCRYRMIDY